MPEYDEDEEHIEELERYRLIYDIEFGESKRKHELEIETIKLERLSSLYRTKSLFEEILHYPDTLEDLSRLGRAEEVEVRRPAMAVRPPPLLRPPITYRAITDIFAEEEDEDEDEELIEEEEEDFDEELGEEDNVADLDDEVE